MREYNDVSIGSSREAAGHARLAIAVLAAALLTAVLLCLAVTSPTTI